MRRVALLMLGLVSLGVLASCTWYQETHQADGAAPAVETADSVDIPTVRGDAPAQTVSNEHGTVTIDCNGMAYTVNGTPGDRYLVEVGAQPPAEFTMNESGAHSSYWTFGPYEAHAFNEWRVHLMPADVAVLQGSIDCS